MIQSTQQNPFVGLDAANIPSPVAQFQGKPKKGGSKNVIFVLFLLLVAIVGAGGYWYFSTNQNGGTVYPTPTPTVTTTTTTAVTPTPTTIPTLDPATPATTFKSQVLNLTMTVPGRFGTVTQTKSASTDTKIVCDVESFRYDYSTFQGGMLKGAATCMSDLLGNATQTYQLKTKDGKNFTVKVISNDDDAKTTTLAATFRADNIGVNLALTQIAAKDLVKAQSDMQSIVESLTLTL